MARRWDTWIADRSSRFSAPHRSLGRRLQRRTKINTADTITIRRAGPEDRTALDRLAGRDSAVLPDDDFLIAEVADEAWAAIGLRTRALVADPFRPSGQVAELLRLRVERSDGRELLASPAAPLRPVSDSPACS
jgi:hypothetical protein